ncbi:amidohydrolase [Chromatiales bacterium (ex Bugula neritina AB1)]|nr:amidohydrolase [Chromatiales bacterium (ex Bugula neritina AB1)]
MPIVNRFADLLAEITEWRRDIHAHPELQYDVQRTAGIVAAKLREFGVDEVVEGIGRTGVVGLIKSTTGSTDQVIGLRADMDALPIREVTGLPHASEFEGKMHACGHDGHTAMLLGAAKYLCETRNFSGTVAVIFQPAEEGGGGGREMVNDGMMDRFGIQQVYGMHNMPGIPIGEFAIRSGPMMAAADLFTVEITGLGGHAAMPHNCVDPTIAAAQITLALQTIVSRNVNPLENAVISVTSFHTDTEACNVIPQTVHLKGTVRTLSSGVRDQLETRMADLIQHTAQAMGATAAFKYQRNYPVTANAVEQTSHAVKVAASVAGEAAVNAEAPAVMGAEDFSFMLNERPGAFIFMGNGNTATLHHPEYDFNDDAIPYGCSYWVQLVEQSMPA